MGLYVYESKHLRMSVYVHVRAGMYVCLHECVSTCIRVQGSLCGSVSESGDVATRAPLGFLPTQRDWPPCWSVSGRWPSALGNAPPHPFIQILIFPLPQGFTVVEAGSSLIQNTPTMHCKILDLGCLKALGSHWLDCCFLIGL